ASRESGEFLLRLSVMRISWFSWHFCQISRSVASRRSPRSSKWKRVKPRWIQNSSQLAPCISRTRSSTGPRVLTSARIPFTIFLLTLFFENESQARQAFFRSSFELGKARPLLLNSFRNAVANETVLVVQRSLVGSVVALNYGNLLYGKCGNPTDDLLVGASFLKIGHQILDGDAAS